jgi:PIN like domain
MVDRAQKSKKSSVASFRSRRDADRLAALTFFIDRSLGRYVVASELKKAGAIVEVHDDHFAPNTPDVEWLRSVGDKEWVVLSKDEAIRRNRNERETIRAAGVKAFFLTQQGLNGMEMAAVFARALPGMVMRAAREKGSFVFTISTTGVFSRVD